MPEIYQGETDKPKRVTILGATGSIGVNTLKVIESLPEKFTVVGLSAGGNIALLKEQVLRFKPSFVAVKNRELMRSLRAEIGNSRVRILYGKQGISELAGMDDADIVVSAISGAAGLLPTVTAVRKGKRVALANKESMVIAGNLIVMMAKKSGAEIIPVDSEHSAVFQALMGNEREHLRKIILTASGGPFLNTPANRLRFVRPEDALKHPKWKMGRKITIDSATLMNKALEIIEARWFFNVLPSMIEVLVHPECLVHSIVEFNDGSMLAQMAMPDMRTPIAFALSYPERVALRLKRLDLADIHALHFLKPDTTRFPSLKFAYNVISSFGNTGRTMPAVLNAANEVAVHAFLSGEIRFHEIFDIIEHTIDLHNPVVPECLEDYLDADRWARQKAEEYITKRRRN